MSYENPTRLRLGMHGNFNGQDYRLLGRVVLGVVDDGETYYWNEFNLAAADGTFATLVYEVTERGEEWRLFTLFDPEYPITAADAATKRLGDHLNLTGTDVQVTLRDTSRVYRIEGTPPAGLQVGDTAHYFNAEAGDLMQVVSWTGDEVECYNGVNLARSVVMSAFNLPYSEGDRLGLGQAFSSLSGGSGETYNSGMKFAIQAGIILLLFFLFFGRFLSCSSNREAPPVKKIYVAKSVLPLGAAGTLLEHAYRLTGHAVVETATVGAVFQRHEYQLTDDYGQSRLLLSGLRAGDTNWMLFSPLTPFLPPAASDCAAKRVGDSANIDGVVGNVKELFLVTVRDREGMGPNDWPAGGCAYGYLAESVSQTLLVRWNDHAVTFRSGQSVPAAQVMAAFGLGTATNGIP